MAASGSGVVDKKLQEQLQKELETFQKLNKDMQKLVSQRTQLDAQFNENKIVKDELDLLEKDANVFKLIGPVLVKQDLSEAQMNVDKRIEYIKGEINRHDKTLQELEGKQTSSRESLAKLQHQYQQAMLRAQALS